MLINASTQLFFFTVKHMQWSLEERLTLFSKLLRNYSYMQMTSETTEELFIYVYDKQEDIFLDR